MNAPEFEPRTARADTTPSASRSRLRFELVFSSVWLAFGLFLLPAAIFLVGGGLLGPYGEGGSIGAFYGDFFGDLAAPSVRAWALALGPLLLVSLIRLAFLGVAPSEEQAVTHHETPAKRGPPPSRIEPRVGTE